MGRMPGGRMGGGIGGLILILLIGYCMGADPSMLLQMASESGAGPATQIGTPERTPGGSTEIPEDDVHANFISAILASTEDVWGAMFAQAGSRYEAPTLVLFDSSVSSACGMNTAATGPFYCPADRQVYMDLSFFRELARLGGPGDFAQAYVVGHEVGHHLQNLMGTSSEVHAAQRGLGRAEANQLSVMLELQADCYAGVWAHYLNRAQGPSGVRLDPGDVEEGLAAAAAIGDDRLMSRAGRAATPDAFTHGSSDQRAYWLKRGI